MKTSWKQKEEAGVQVLNSVETAWLLLFSPHPIYCACSPQDHARQEDGRTCATHHEESLAKTVLHLAKRECKLYQTTMKKYSNILQIKIIGWPFPTSDNVVRIHVSTEIVISAIASLHLFHSKTGTAGILCCKKNVKFLSLGLYEQRCQYVWSMYWYVFIIKSGSHLKHIQAMFGYPWKDALHYWHVEALFAMGGLFSRWTQVQSLAEWMALPKISTWWIWQGASISLGGLL